MKRLGSIASFAIFFIFLSTPIWAGFSLSISPIRWEAKGNAGKTLRQVITLTSGANTVQKVSVSVGDWTLTEGGAPVFFDPGTMPDSAVAWLRLDSQEFTVYPRQKKTFKISIHIPDGALHGSYRAAVLFEQPQPEKTEEEEGTNVFLRGRLALPIYVTVGDAKPNGKILGASWKSVAEGRDPVVALGIRNEGNAHLRMNGIFSATSPTDDKFEGIIPGVPVLPGEERWIPLEFRGEGPPIFSELELSLLTDLGNGEIKHGTKVHGSSQNQDSN